MGTSVHITKDGAVVQGPVTFLGDCANAGTAARLRAAARATRIRISGLLSNGSTLALSYRIEPGISSAAGLELGDPLLGSCQIFGFLEFLDQALVVGKRLGLLLGLVARLCTAIQRLGEVVVHGVAIAE